MIKHIFLRAARHVLDPVDKNAPRKLVHIVCSTSSGDIIRGEVTCTSSNFRNNTFNVRFPDSGEIRKLHFSLLLSINHTEIML
jgi:hypothetical protein